MDEEELHICRKIHGYISSDEESDGATKEEHDRIFNLYKPEPRLFDPKIHTVVDIGCKEELVHQFASYAAILTTRPKENVNAWEQDVKELTKTNPIISEEPADTIKELSKAQRKRLRRQQKKAADMIKINSDNEKPIGCENLSNCDTNKSNIDIANNALTECELNNNTSTLDNQEYKEVSNHGNIGQEGDVSKIEENVEKTKKKKRKRATKKSKASKAEEGTPNKNCSSVYSYNINSDETNVAFITGLNHDSCSNNNYLDVLGENTNKTQISNKMGSPYIGHTVNTEAKEFINSQLSELLSDFEEFLIQNMTDGYKVYEKTQRFISFVLKADIKVTQHIRDICFIITQIAISCENFAKNVQKKEYAFEALKQFFVEFHSVILKVEQKKFVLIYDEEGASEKFLYHRLNCILIHYVEKVIMKITTLSAGHQNFLENNTNTNTKDAVEQRFNWRTMVEIIRQCRVTALPVEHQYCMNFHYTPHSQHNGLIRIDRPLEQPDNGSSRSNKIIKQNDSPNYYCQTQLHLIIEDLTENRRYFYDGSFVGRNAQHWENFQRLYISGVELTTPKTSRLKQKKSRQTSLHPLVIDDLTRDKKHSYPYCDDLNYLEWQVFQSKYLNCDHKTFLSNENCTELSDVVECNTEEINSSDYDFTAPQPVLDLPVMEFLIGGVILVICKPIILSLVFSVLYQYDAILLVLLLLFLCTVFVINF